MNQFVSVADIDSLPAGKGRTVEIRGRRFALWNVDGTFHAIDDECPHRGGPLGAGVLENGKVYCPLHGWEFDVKTGACLSNPARPVASHPTKIENGQVWIAINSFKPTIQEPDRITLPAETMKSSYQLAMERLSKQSPTVKLTDAKKKELAELDSLYRSKIAEREIFLKGELDRAAAKGDPEAMAQLERQMSTDRRRLEEECEEKKERVRGEK